jgi:thymidine kinase
MNQINYGSLEIFLGPMFSGKSTELIRQTRLMKVIGKKVMVIKPKIDNRYVEGKVTSHNWETVECEVIEKLAEITDDKIVDVSLIIVDEGQFFSDLKQIVLYWVETLNKNVVIGGLDGDFKRKPMGQILDLVPYADKVNKFQSRFLKSRHESGGIFLFCFEWEFIIEFARSHFDFCVLRTRVL